MMTLNDTELLKTHFKRSYSGKYGKIYYAEKEQILLCQLTQPYVPIVEFRQLFEKMTKLATKKRFNKFIFDKRALKSFDQPSMEWYFTTWKEVMYKLGVATHRKILPQERWFAQAVIAGRADILKKHPGSIAFTLDIQYCDDFADAMTKLPRLPISTEEYLVSGKL